MSKKVTKVVQIPKLQRKKRVAAYARVSSGKDAMLHSLSAQVSYYNNLIQKEDGLEFVCVYSDEAITGTKVERPGFQQMLEDCRNNKIDMILTKSISRFARNTVTLLETVRMLKTLEVDVFFEEQNIHTLSADGELLLTMLASYAQEESFSTSENQKWRIKCTFEAGEPWNGRALGYRKRDGKYIVIPEEAEIVKRIFTEYLDGAGLNYIANRLTEDGVPTKSGGIWYPRSVAHILKNYSYTGNLLLQTTFREDCISKKRHINTGQRPRYHATETHEAIIDIDTFNKVQEEIARRAEFAPHNPPGTAVYAYTGKIECAKCGKHYRRKTARSKAVWICATLNFRGKQFCASKQIPEICLDAVVNELGVPMKSIDHIVADEGNTLHFHLADGQVITKVWKDRSRAEAWTPEMRAEARKRSIERNHNNG